MKSIVITAAVALSALPRAAQAASTLTDNQFLQVARCRGPAESEGLGQLDTASIDQLLRAQSRTRTLAVKASTNNKINAATAQGDKAQGANKDRLLAERQSECATWLQAAQ